MNYIVEVTTNCIDGTINANNIITNYISRNYTMTIYKQFISYSKLYLLIRNSRITKKFFQSMEKRTMNNKERPKRRRKHKEEKIQKRRKKK
jgi:glycogen synthase